MTPERIRDVLNKRHTVEEKIMLKDWTLVKDFWFNTGCLANDLIEMPDDDLNELWARFVFDRVAETKEA